ncbi:MAG: hypothetical protein M3R44_03945 [Candidatus Eremiobacteraeota bacterium]|nr:hypothetical protein [Candidatus Eremiobacteraeota bacterium]
MTLRAWLAGAVCAGFVATAGCLAAAEGLRIVPVDPLPGAHVSSERPTIEFEIHTVDNATVSRNDVNVTLDGLDASRELQIAGTRLDIVPHDRLNLGAHQIDVSVEASDGERAVDHWTFTVDSNDAAVPTVRDDTSANDAGGAYSEGSGGEGGYNHGGGYGYGNYGYGGGAYGLPYGYYPGSGAFFPVGYGPYYVGEPLNFIYSGLGLGGFVTVNGFPGQYPLVPFAPYYYFVTVPVPANYNGGTPVGVCHLPHDRRRLLSSRPVTVEHTRRPAGTRAPSWVRPGWRPTLAALTTLPGTPNTVRHLLAQRAANGAWASVRPGSVTIVHSALGSRTVEPRIVPTVPHPVAPMPHAVTVPHVVPETSHGVVSEPRNIPEVPRVSGLTPLRPDFSPAAPHFAPFAPHFAPPASSYVAPAPLAPRAVAPVMHAAPVVHAAPVSAHI